jgi:hypothetical protein
MKAVMETSKEELKVMDLEANPEATEAILEWQEVCKKTPTTKQTGPWELWVLEEVGRCSKKDDTPCRSCTAQGRTRKSPARANFVRGIPTEWTFGKR